MNDIQQKTNIDTSRNTAEMTASFGKTSLHHLKNETPFKNVDYCVDREYKKCLHDVDTREKLEKFKKQMKIIGFRAIANIVTEMHKM
jgi:hypothetical protein